MNKNNRIVITLIIIMTLTLSFILAGCVDYGYFFHYRVVGGNGEITTENSNLVKSAELCNESVFCELDCPENSYVISRLGNKKSTGPITFLAIPDKGYQVKE